MAEIENLKIGSGGTIHIVGNEDIVAEAWAAGQSYVKDKSYVINNHVLYVCNTSHTSTSPFDPTNWTAITVGESLTSLFDAINEVIATSKLNPVYGNTASGAIATFDTSLALPLQDCTIDINAVQESGTPTPISPKAISGFTGANIKVVGSNLWDEDWELGDISASTGQNTNDNSRIRSKNYIPVTPNTTLYCHIENYTIRNRIAFYDVNKTYLGQNTGGWDTMPNGTYTTPANAYFMRFYVEAATYGNDISINYPATDTAYHAYNANSHTTAITWQSEAGTVYGGGLKIANGIVKLPVTRYGMKLNAIKPTYNSAYGFFAYYNTQIPVERKVSSQNIKCECYAVYPNYISSVSQIENLPDKTIYYQNNSAHFFIKDTDYTDATAFVNGVGDNLVVYERETPVEYTLASVPPIYTLNGKNNIFCDTNGNTSVVYACSLKDYIDSQ